jgi:hypothetical protein
MIITDVGEFPAPEPIVKAHNEAARRKDGGVDRRTKSGRHFLRLEREFIVQARADYA